MLHSLSTVAPLRQTPGPSGCYGYCPDDLPVPAHRPNLTQGPKDPVAVRFVADAYRRVIIFHDYIPDCIIWYSIIWYNIMSYYIIVYRWLLIIVYHSISYHIISYHTISCHIISYHIIWHNIISYHIKYIQIPFCSSKGFGSHENIFKPHHVTSCFVYICSQPTCQLHALDVLIAQSTDGLRCRGVCVT